ncbi:MAG: MFS transporter [Spirochaetae bacterium HGW-Spirochaetae-1]|nr:MAG: MFS transporter [Spirochaetae bacterium HGW-Spirochaetae-1]
MKETKNTGMNQAFRALQHRNFRLFFMGQGVSLIGTWMQSVAVSWLVYRLTRSPLALGIVGFSGQIPAFILSPFAGVLSDRQSRHRILIITQTLAMVQAVTLTIIAATEIVAVWHIVLLSFFLGVVNAFDMPIRQAFVIEMVEDKKHLANAIALNSSIFNASRLVGPALAGIIIAVAGETACFTINAVSYVASIMALVSMRIPYIKPGIPEQNILADMKKGFTYVLNFTPIRDLLIMVSMMSLVAMSFPVLLPVFATEILHGQSHTYGFLTASTGVGALLGTIFLSMRKSVLGLGRIIAASVFIFGLGLAGLSLSRSVPLSMVLLAIIGFGMIVNIASCNTILQTIVREDIRGRVMSFYTMAFMGAAPIGSLITGSLSSRIGAPATVFAGGVFIILAGILFIGRLPALRRSIRPVYVKLGILPEVAMGLQTASALRKPPEYSGG